MQIELIGCTSAGKSTLVGGIVRAFQEQDIDILTAEDFVLAQCHMQHLNTRWARLFLGDMVALLAGLVTWRAHRRFCVFAVRLILQLPVGLFEKLNAIRNVLKKVAVYELIQRRATDHQVILVDEGSLHAAHNLFVHVAVPPSADQLSTFLKIVPLPDVAVYLKQSEETLIARTLGRGHARVPSGSYADVACFIKRAVATFDWLAQQSKVASRLIIVDAERCMIAAEDATNDPVIVEASNIIHAGLAAVATRESRSATSAGTLASAQPPATIVR